ARAPARPAESAQFPGAHGPNRPSGNHSPWVSGRPATVADPPADRADDGPPQSCADSQMSPAQAKPADQPVKSAPAWPVQPPADAAGQSPARLRSDPAPLSQQLGWPGPASGLKSRCRSQHPECASFWAGPDGADTTRQSADLPGGAGSAPGPPGPGVEK